MRDVMVDTETLGTVPGAVVMSIGAVAFDAQNTDEEQGFNITIHRPSCEEVFLEVNKETEAWWSRQSEEAREVIARSMDPTKSVPLTTALQRFNDYLGRFGGRGAGTGSGVRVWGNGSDFDNALLAVCFDAANVRPGWEFWNNRCYRTLKNQAPDIKIVRGGTYHDAFDDAVDQAKHLQRILAAKGLVLG
jgi:hypothetical protein